MEAWEEAGVEGEVEPTPFSFYEYETGNGHFHVSVFKMQVKHEENEWPERAERLRRWHSLGEAISIVSGGPLRNVLNQFHSKGPPFPPPKL